MRWETSSARFLLLYLPIVASAGWVIVNAGIISQPFDPFPYSLLSSITSLEAVLIAAFVLMKQNRMGIIADRRDHTQPASQSADRTAGDPNYSDAGSPQPPFGRRAAP